MTAMEFLNLLCYRMDKLEKSKKDIELWKSKH